MRILHLSTFKRGGAGKSAVRLNNGLNNLNLSSKLGFKETSINLDQTEFTIPINLNFIQKVKFKLTDQLIESTFNKRLANRNEGFEKFSTISSDYNILELREYREADIVHLHWVADLLDFKTFFVKNLKPVVWSLCDLNPLTGGCHYPMDCNKFEFDCSNCPQLPKGKVNEIAKNQLQIKKNIHSSIKSKLHFVSPANWMDSQIAKSSFGAFQRSIIPHPSDESIYFSLDKVNAKIVNDLPLDKLIVLFASENLNNPRKGYQFFENLAREFINEPIVFLLIGHGSKLDNIKENIITLDYIIDERKLNEIYNACDLVLIPSIQDNLPLTLIDANMAGTPVLTFSIGGANQWVKNGINGFKIGEATQINLVNSLKQILKNPGSIPSQEIVKNYALKNFSKDSVAKMYRVLYQKLLSNM